MLLKNYKVYEIIKNTYNNWKLYRFKTSKLNSHNKWCLIRRRSNCKIKTFNNGLLDIRELTERNLDVVLCIASLCKQAVEVATMKAGVYDKLNVRFAELASNHPVSSNFVYWIYQF